MNTESVVLVESMVRSALFGESDQLARSVLSYRIPPAADPSTGARQTIAPNQSNRPDVPECATGPRSKKQRLSNATITSGSSATSSNTSLNVAHATATALQVSVEGFWIARGPLELEQQSDYIITRAVRDNLKSLARIISMG